MRVKPVPPEGQLHHIVRGLPRFLELLVLEHEKTAFDGSLFRFDGQPHRFGYEQAFHRLFDLLFRHIARLHRFRFEDVL